MICFYYRWVLFLVKYNVQVFDTLHSEVFNCFKVESDAFRRNKEASKVQITSNSNNNLVC